MSKLTVCVAMCTYNGTKYLQQQLDSIAAQSCPPDRMVIVDDSSTDGTVEIAHAFARGADFPVHVTTNDKNLGYAKNFERAIELSDGDVIALSDQDDVWHPRKLEEFATVFRRSPPAGLVFSDANVVDDELNPLGYRLWDAVRFSEARQFEIAHGHAFEVLLRGNIVTGAAMAFRSEYKRLVLPIEGGLHDAWIALLIAAVADVVMVPEPLVDYRQHSSNQIGAKKLNRLQRMLKAKRLQPEELDRLDRAYRRLLECGGVSPQRIALMQEFIDHLAIRIALPERRVYRLKFVCRDLWNGRYRRLWGSSRSAVHDVVAS